MTAPAIRRKGKSAAETGPEAHDLASRPKDFLTKGEVRALLAAAKDGRHGARDHLLLTMIFQHGLRAIEACHLRVDQVDLEAARVWVERVKGGQSTHQPLTGDEVRMIRAYLRERKFDTQWLFVGERGDQLSRHAIQYIVRQAATRARCVIPAATTSPNAARSFARCRTTWATRTRGTPRTIRASPDASSWGCSNDPSHPHRSRPQHGPLLHDGPAADPVRRVGAAPFEFCVLGLSELALFGAQTLR